MCRGPQRVAGVAEQRHRVAVVLARVVGVPLGPAPAGQHVVALVRR